MERQQKANRRQRERGIEEEQKRILSENRRTVRDNYDNAAALYKHKKKFRRNLVYAMLGLFLCSIGVVALSFLLFQVKQVEVSGSGTYSEQALRETIGLEGGENMFLINTSAIVDRLCVTYPYIETVQVDRKWPDTICFTITEAYNAYAVPVVGSEGKYALLSTGEKVLGITEEGPPADVCLVSGASVSEPKPGYAAVYSDDTDTALFHDLLRSLGENGFERLDRLDMSDSVDILVEYEQRLTIRIGTAASLDYKLQFARHLIDEEIDPKQSGTIDVRNASLRKASFQPGAALGTTEALTGEEQPEESSSTGPMTDEGDYSPEAEKPYRG